MTLSSLLCLAGFCISILLAITSAGPAASERASVDTKKPRLLVLTDIGGDPDDQQSMVRLMLYANEFDVEGLIASASGTPGELKEKVTKPELIREIVRAYGQVRVNLALHADGYPPAQALLDRVKSGNPERGREAVGEGRDTDGSRWIVQVVDRPDPRPVNIAIWGGQTDLAQALWRVRRDRGDEGLGRFIAKLRIHDIADQDGIAGWMWEQFPGLFYILDRPRQGRDRREAAFRGMYLGGDESLVSREWMETHVRQNHGPLGALYPPRTWTAPNPHSAIKEGDTPSWFYFLPHGLNHPDHPEWGGWGGRFTSEGGRLYRDAQDRMGDVTDARATVWRWRPAFQADFQARLDWCVQPFDRANHPPVAVLNGDGSRAILEIGARSGEQVALSAEGSRDPDGGSISARWSVYPEAGTFRGEVRLSRAEGLRTHFTAPAVTGPQTVHVILEVRDDGTPGLSAFRRAVVTVQP
jgi:cellulose-binding protein